MKTLPFPSLPESATAESVAIDGLRHATFVTFADPHALPTTLGFLKGQRRHLAVARIDPWSVWFFQKFGDTASAVPDETVLLLWEKSEGGYGVLVPLVHRGQRAWLAGTPEGLELRTQKWDRANAKGAATLLFTAEGDDPFALVERAIAAIAERLRSFRIRTQKPTPDWIEWFGWCTWDAFYREVNVEGVLAGLEKARAGGLQPRLLILDDGWQDTDGKLLQGFAADPKKFPNGLSELIRRAKAEFGVGTFGVWHAFQGYWYGVDPQSPAGKPYRVFDAVQAPHSRPTEEPARRVLIHPDDIARFYHDYYRELRAAGVDMVKVDNQANLDHSLSAETTPPALTMQRYQEAFQGAAAHHFRGETLHCMSQITDMLYHLDSGNVVRNSEDYYPTIPATQGKHVFRNALNNVFMAPFCVPDWDMFQSSREAAPFHAASRAISGGPLYISDKPGEQNFELLRKLITADGRALRCPQPALPTRDCLFVDAYHQPHLFKIQNRNGDTGVLGLFNCHWDEQAKAGQPVSGRYSAADVEGISGERFALFHHSTGKVELVTRADIFEVTLPPLGWELVTVAPIEDGVALIGLANKLNGSAALVSKRWISPTRLEITLREGGPLALHLDRPLVSASVAGTKIALTRGAAGASILDLPVVSEPTLTLEF